MGVAGQWQTGWAVTAVAMVQHQDAAGWFGYFVSNWTVTSCQVQGVTSGWQNYHKQIHLSKVLLYIIYVNPFSDQFTKSVHTQRHKGLFQFFRVNACTAFVCTACAMIQQRQQIPHLPTFQEVSNFLHPVNHCGYIRANLSRREGLVAWGMEAQITE